MEDHQAQDLGFKTGGWIAAIVFSLVIGFFGAVMSDAWQTDGELIVGWIIVSAAAFFFVAIGYSVMVSQREKDHEQTQAANAVLEINERQKSGSNRNAVKELKDLKQLLDDGVLTQEEFDDQKRRLLS